MIKVLACDVGGTSVKYGLWHDGKLDNISKFVTPMTWPEMKKSLLEIRKQAGDIQGVAFAFPGAVNITSGQILGSSAVPYIHNFNIVKELTNLLEIPVSIQNDANSAALAEVWQGNATDVSNSAFLILGSGVGGAVVVDGSLQPGSHLFGGEFGYQILDWKSGETVSELATPVSVGRKYSKTVNDGKEYSGLDVFDLAQAGNKLARQVVADFYQALGSVIYNVALTTDPDRILLGGAISQRKELLPRLKEEVYCQIQRHGAKGLQVDLRCCYFFENANLLGAVYQFLQENKLPCLKCKY